MEICSVSSCTGCGMCANLCPVKAITMVKGTNDFIFPRIDTSVCISCNQCVQKCPANQPTDKTENVIGAYAAWNKNKTVRKKSSSGGIFSAIADQFLKEGGLVVGVAMCGLKASHAVVSNIAELPSLYGSKYVQSETGDIYIKVKGYLESGKKVLFSGTPCQNHALRQFLDREYEKLFMVDLVCHGVPSLTMLQKHVNEVSGDKKTEKILFRFKDPYWDYPYVRIEYEDNSSPYQRLTVDDDYFHLFNIGFSIRNSCHSCHYTCTHRQGDITLADCWGYRAHNLKMRNYFDGISLILVNNDKGERVLEQIKPALQIEPTSLENAKRSNKCLTEPFALSEDALNNFWRDYSDGMSISELSKKHYPKKFVRPNYLCLRHMKAKYYWIIK